MNSTLDPALEQLRDIHGLDPIAWWPLAPGWWVVIGVIVAAVLIGFGLRWWITVWHRDWRTDARNRLRKLGARIQQLGAKEAAAQISALLRRIAMARYGRTMCASLIGQEWLDWLNIHDPAGFPWAERGKILIDLPYAPPRDQVRTPGSDPDNLRTLVEAILPWLEVKEASSNTQVPSSLRIRLAFKHIDR